MDPITLAREKITKQYLKLSKRNYKSETNEILDLVSRFGEELERHLLCCFFSDTLFSDVLPMKDSLYRVKFIKRVFRMLILEPHFTSMICFAVENPFPQGKSLETMKDNWLSNLCEKLGLSAIEDIALGLSLQYSSSPEICIDSTQFLKQKLSKFFTPPIKTEFGRSSTIQRSVRHTKLLQQICYHLQNDIFRISVGILPEDRIKFFNELKLGYPEGLIPVVLTPYLTNSSSFELTPTTMITSLVEMLCEIGYGFSKSKEQCRNALVQFGVKNITPTAVARVLGFMARVPAGFVDPLTGQNPFIGNNSNSLEGGEEDLNAEQDTSITWNVEIFIQTVKELVPSFPWKDIIKELDHPGFHVSNKSGFENLVKGLFLVVDSFPIDFLYNPWKNKEGQISWISNALKYPDVFCFANFAYTSVDVSFLKNPPDDKLRDIATWKSLELINVLLSLSDDGLQSQVLELLKFPMTQCPDLLLIGILKTDRWHFFNEELIPTLLPIFFGQHNNALSVLTFTWHIQGNLKMRTMVLRAMAKWYSTDSSRLAGIFDMVQDLKALSTLLNAPPNTFVIDLACLASRREYLKLDKWVNDKRTEYGEHFITDFSNFVIAKLFNSATDDDQASFDDLYICILKYMKLKGKFSSPLGQTIFRLKWMLQRENQTSREWVYTDFEVFETWHKRNLFSSHFLRGLPHQMKKELAISLFSIIELNKVMHEKMMLVIKEDRFKRRELAWRRKALGDFMTTTLDQIQFLLKALKATDFDMSFLNGVVQIDEKMTWLHTFLNNQENVSEPLIVLTLLSTIFHAGPLGAIRRCFRVIDHICEDWEGFKELIIQIENQKYLFSRLGLISVWEMPPELADLGYLLEDMCRIEKKFIGDYYDNGEELLANVDWIAKRWRQDLDEVLQENDILEDKDGLHSFM